MEELAGERLLGLALWEGLRDVALWARADADARGALFDPAPSGFRDYAADVVEEAELADAWARLDAVARDPRDVETDGLADACQAVYAWAEERAFMRTAAHFAEAAALVKPDAPALANLAARTCRRAGLPARAGPWYQRGRALAVRADSFPDKFSASVGYGWLMYGLGRYDRARRVVNSTVRQAVNRGHRRMAGEAEHALLAICSEVGMFFAGETHAISALRHYPMHHERLPALVHDVGYFYVTARLYTPALAILNDVVKVFRPQEATIVVSTLARAAAGAARLEAYRSARDTVLSLVPRYPEHAPAALRNIAFAAQLMEEWDVAEHAARTSVELAHAGRMADVERTARELLARVQAHAQGAPEAAPPAGSHVEEIVRLCRLKLRQWSGPKRGRPPGQTPPV